MARLSSLKNMIRLRIDLELRSVPKRRTRDVVNSPDLTAECYDVGGGSDKLQRRGPVKPGSNDVERAVRINLH